MPVRVSSPAESCGHRCGHIASDLSVPGNGSAYGTHWASRGRDVDLLRLPPLPFSDDPIEEQADVLGFVVVSR